MERSKHDVYVKVNTMFRHRRKKFRARRNQLNGGVVGGKDYAISLVVALYGTSLRRGRPLSLSAAASPKSGPIHRQRTLCALIQVLPEYLQYQRFYLVPHERIKP
jgi:hypothetical protein